MMKDNKKPKLFKNLVDAVLLALQEIVEGNKYADKVLEKVLKSNPKWGARDRAFIAETTYDIVRNQRLLEYLSEQSIGHTSLSSMLAMYLIQVGYEIPEWEMFKSVHGVTDHHLYNTIQATSQQAILYSYPDWLYQLLQSELGDEKLSTELEALSLTASVYLRVNTLKVQPKKLQTLLEEEGIRTELIAPWVTLKLHTRQNVFRSKYFKLGYFEVQDWSSQQVALALNVEPGMRVIDACAGGGGKTLHIAMLMQNKGKIIAMDTEEWKLKNLMQRAARAGVTIIEPRLIESSKTIKRLHESCDRLLLDVPCSGLGVLKRNPDTKWKLTLESVRATQTLQQDIIANYSDMLKPHSEMVYATCSILPSENEKQVQQFLSTHQSYQLMEDKTIYPSQHESDGFYMARLKN
jgi:16S rRNA (cytosine967-C5)-methyltransferase